MTELAAGFGFKWAAQGSTYKKWPQGLFRWTIVRAGVYWSYCILRSDSRRLVCSATVLTESSSGSPTPVNVTMVGLDGSSASIWKNPKQKLERHISKRAAIKCSTPSKHPPLWGYCGQTNTAHKLASPLWVADRVPTEFRKRETVLWAPHRLDYRGPTCASPVWSPHRIPSWGPNRRELYWQVRSMS